jgi:RES domain-containing protein
MSLRIYRICRARYARLDGEGARRVGGRWNSPGRTVVYMAGVALAVLENLVHMSRQDFPAGYVCVAAIIPDGIAIATERELRLKFTTHQNLTSQALGDLWIDGCQTAVLEVASAVVQAEHLYLLNPAHPDFSKITLDPPALFHFDSRLFS